MQAQRLLYSVFIVGMHHTNAMLLVFVRCYHLTNTSSMWPAPDGYVLADVGVSVAGQGTLIIRLIIKI